MKKKTVALLMALVLIFGVAAGGTVAWLTDKTETITNTFIDSDINITLTETKGGDAKTFKMIPGGTIDKDPKVTVKAGSEACWLFVKLEKSANYDDYLAHGIADGWTAVPGADGVYYRKENATSADVTYSVLAGDKLTVDNDVTKAMMDEIDDPTETKPTLTVTAYAIQYANLKDGDGNALDEGDIADIWNLAKSNP